MLLIRLTGRGTTAFLVERCPLFSIKNQMGNRQDLRMFDTLRDILRTHRPWWQTEQDYGNDPRVRFRDPNSPCIFRLTLHRAFPSGLAP